VDGLINTFEEFMNWIQIHDEWYKLRDVVRESWGELTNEDLAVIDGKREKFISCIQDKYGLARNEAERRVRQWQRDIRTSLDSINSHP
jgi:uncharacterized protein YjbJ (UPF0337 family)